MRFVLVVLLAGCVTHVRVSTEALRYPPAVEGDGPIVLAAVDDDGHETSVEVRPDTRITVRLARGRVEARARDIVSTDDALVVRHDRRIPWDRVRGADLTEARPWLAFAIVLGGCVATAGIVALAESDL